jgi:hypothetical protein
MFGLQFEGIFIEVKSLFKFIFVPYWRRSYRIAKYMHEGLTAQEAMILVGVLKA